MNTEQRRRAVADILAEDPQASGRSIAKRLGCPQASIRRDLLLLRPESPPESPGESPAAPSTSGQVRSGDAQRIIAALNAELAESAKQVGHELIWSAAEQDVIDMIAAEVDRRVELTVAWEACDNVNVRLRLATELRLLEGAIARLYRQVSTDVPGPQSAVSRKAQHAANSRWKRYQMGQGPHHAN